MMSASVAPPLTNDTATASSPEMKAPMIGKNPPMNTSRHQRQDERCPDDRQTDPDEDRVDESDDGETPDVARQRPPGGLEAPPGAIRVGHPFQQSLVRPIAVLEVEKGHQQRENETGDDLHSDGRPTEHTSGDRSGIVLDLSSRVFDVALDIGLRQSERPFAQPFRGRLHRLVYSVTERFDPVCERRHQEENQHGDHRDETEDRPPGGEGRRPPSRLEPLDERAEHGRGEQTEDESAARPP